MPDTHPQDHPSTGTPVGPIAIPPPPSPRSSWRSCEKVPLGKWRVVRWVGVPTTKVKKKHTTKTCMYQSCKMHWRPFLATQDKGVESSSIVWWWSGVDSASEINRRSSQNKTSINAKKNPYHGPYNAGEIYESPGSCLDQSSCVILRAFVHERNPSYAMARRSPSFWDPSPQIRYLSRSTLKVDPELHRHTPRLRTCIEHHLMYPGVHIGSEHNGPSGWLTIQHVNTMNILGNCWDVHLKRFHQSIAMYQHWVGQHLTSSKKGKHYYKNCGTLWSRLHSFSQERFQGVSVRCVELRRSCHIVTPHCPAEMTDRNRRIPRC